MARPKKGTTFWDRVYSQVERVGECLIFTGCKDDCGYGRINRDGKLVRIHRAVWERDHYPLGKGFVIMHQCDNPACIEPAHLSVGVQADNIRDMDSKGRRRSLYGIEQSQAKLNDERVRAVRSRLAAGETCISIAKDYSVSDGLIRNIKKDRNWKHVS